MVAEGKCEESVRFHWEQGRDLTRGSGGILRLLSDVLTQREEDAAPRSPENDMPRAHDARTAKPRNLNNS